MSSEFIVIDQASGDILDGEPTQELMARGSGEAWWSPAAPAAPGDPGTWHLRHPLDRAGSACRSVQVLCPGGDPDWYENTVENLETSEGA